MRSLRVVPALAFGLVASLVGPTAEAATDCKAEVRTRPGTDQVSDESVTKVFAVEIDTQEQCAKVYVDVVVTERLFNGEEITSTRRGSRKVTNHVSTHKVNFKIARDSTLVSSTFKVARCVVCGTE
jgi:hypothetical protein